MKKTYEELQINVIALDNADVITASFASPAFNGLNYLGNFFNFGDGMDTQDFQ